MNHHNIKGKLLSGNTEHTVETPVFIFQDQGTWFYYAPALDLTGYGDTQSAAQESFGIALEEFMRYGTQKGTLKKALVSLGWTYHTLKRKKQRLDSPPLHALLERDDYLQEIFTHRDFHKVNHEVQLPALA